MNYYMLKPSDVLQNYSLQQITIILKW